VRSHQQNRSEPMTQLFASLQNGVTAVVTETGLRRLEAQSARAFELMAQASEREAWNQATMRTGRLS
jgi:hypothetical protein